MTITTTDTTFDELLASTPTILVDFWAPWCGPCLAVAPHLDQLVAENSTKMSLAKLNVDDNPAIAQRFSVMSIPTMILFKNAEPVLRITGAYPLAKLRELVAPHLG